MDELKLITFAVLFEKKFRPLLDVVGVDVDDNLGSISSTCLCAVFTHADPKSVKKTVKLRCFLCFQDLCA